MNTEYLILSIPDQTLDLAIRRSLNRITTKPGPNPSLFTITSFRRETNGAEIRYLLFHPFWSPDQPFGAVRLLHINPARSGLGLIEPDVFDLTIPLDPSLFFFTAAPTSLQGDPLEAELSSVQTFEIDELVRTSHTVAFRNIIRRFLVHLKADLANQGFTFTPPHPQPGPDGIDWFVHYFYHAEWQAAEFAHLNEKPGRPRLSGDQLFYYLAKAQEARKLRQEKSNITREEVARAINWKYGLSEAALKRLDRACKRLAVYEQNDPDGLLPQLSARKKVTKMT